ncbi:hypothetical protein COU15_00075 [Candidatus Kaiserbacteria bacterium CG10_big_fil_rev_8_21_14_0_10_45_20]|uniref:Uncharacterized protein n=1 Tax=Candidatus Kaiserbacteria bacterium CG10_big_fil_rev_8_21_14_0_10_45_20 TaxID=1974607 RepID=A0A2H0UGF0_9BACT|nr:MAG: hypothetical protein COU15_00075 [Candidatus Kaiserbacteria bacterium CG10_big_fil_rev_8_21_14_0_10_45_20]
MNRNRNEQPYANDNDIESTRIYFTSVYFDGENPYAVFNGETWNVKIDNEGNPITRKSPRRGMEENPLIKIYQGSKTRWVHWRNKSTAVLRVSH